MPKVCCITWYNKSAHKHADLFFSSNKDYCDKFGYDCFKSNKTYVQDKSDRWQLLSCLQDLLDSDYEYIVCLDTYISLLGGEDHITINDIVTSVSDSDLILGNGPHAGLNIDLGIFIVKNTYRVRRFIEFWINDHDTYKSIQNKNEFAGGPQEMFMYIYFSDMFSVSSYSTILPYGELFYFAGSEVPRKSLSTNASNLQGDYNKLLYIENYKKINNEH